MRNLYANGIEFWEEKKIKSYCIDSRLIIVRTKFLSVLIYWFIKKILITITDFKELWPVFLIAIFDELYKAYCDTKKKSLFCPWNAEQPDCRTNYRRRAFCETSNVLGLIKLQNNPFHVQAKRNSHVTLNYANSQGLKTLTTGLICNISYPLFSAYPLRSKKENSKIVSIFLWTRTCDGKFCKWNGNRKKIFVFKRNCLIKIDE